MACRFAPRHRVQTREPSMTKTAERVPPHLRRYVVEQDYSQYTGVDQAVWRFVLLQMVDKLRLTAHAAYAKGLGDTGISVERIRSEERRVGKECRARWSPYQEKT